MDMKNKMVFGFIILAVALAAPFAVEFITEKNQKQTSLKNEKAYIELTAYEQEIYDLYQNTWHRPPEQSEIDFHAQHQTPTLRLANWLEQQANTVANCDFPSDLDPEQVKEVYSYFEDHAMQAPSCEVLIAQSYQQPTQVQFVSWLATQAPDYLLEEPTLPADDVQLTASNGNANYTNFYLNYFNSTQILTFNNENNLSAPSVLFNWPLSAGELPRLFRPPMV